MDESWTASLPVLRLRSVASSLILALLFLPAPSALASAKGWLAFGDLRGYLEPCGCDPESDLGGVKRIKTIIDRERLVDDSFAVFALGNFLPPKDVDGEVKIPFLLQAVAEIKPTVALFNVLELMHIDRVRDAKAEINFVLANRQSEFLEKRISDFFVIPNGGKGIYVTGFVSPTDKLLLRQLDEDLIARWRVAAKKADESVLLFAGTSKDLERIKEANIFDTIIRSNTRPFSADPDLKEMADETLLFDEKSDTWMVPLGGQGILRGGPMALHKTKSLTEIVGGPATNCNNPLGFPGAATCADPNELLPKPVTWLPRTVGGDHLFASLFSAYEKEVSGEFTRREKRRATLLAKTPFGGVDACATCHPKAAAKWKSTAHANAMKTLIDGNKAKDWECVKCHAVGADVDGGYVSQAKSPQFANVQCENCHGAAKAHLTNPTIKPSRDPKGCETCHHQPHSSAFEFSKYWEKIEHGKEAAMP